MKCTHPNGHFLDNQGLCHECGTPIERELAREERLPQAAIQSYIDILEGAEGVYSTSHVHLRLLYLAHGKARVDAAIDRYYHEREKNNA